MRPQPQLDVWDDDELARYIVEFLLAIPCWKIIVYTLVQMAPLDEGDKLLKVGFTWHVWALPDGLWMKVFELISKQDKVMIS